MRARICINSRDKVYKLTWVNEDAKGVYIGCYGEMCETHISYHKDGMRHIRVKNGKEPLNSDKLRPIDEIDSYMLIASQFSAIDEKNMNLLATPHSFDEKMTSELFINKDILNPDEPLRLSYFLVCDQAEDEFIDRQYSKLDLKLIAFNLFRLEKFPNHKLAIILLDKIKSNN